MSYDFKAVKAAAEDILAEIVRLNPDSVARADAFMGRTGDPSVPDASPQVPFSDAARHAAVVGAMKAVQHRMGDFRERLLLDLANLKTDDGRLLRRMKDLEPKMPEAIGATQKLLQAIWDHDLSLDIKQTWVNYLLVAALHSKIVSSPRIFAPLALGSLQFAGVNFFGQVLVGILENWHRMVRCGNPECPTPYFYAGRSSQRYCERGDCTKYALRAKALKWWNENRAGKKSRTKARSGSKTARHAPTPIGTRL